MTGAPARIGLIVVGLTAVAVGLVWIGQGLNLIPGSVMTGNLTWFWVGIVVLVIGAVLIALGLKRRRPVR